MSTVTWTLENNTQNTLQVFAYRGSDFVEYFNGLQILPTESAVIARSNDPGGVTDDTYDWVILKDLGTGSLYQVYAEDQGGLPNTYYAFFGYFNPNSSEGDANPSPFPQGDANATWLPTTGQPMYTLRITPPAAQPTSAQKAALEALISEPALAV